MLLLIAFVVVLHCDYTIVLLQQKAKNVSWLILGTKEEEEEQI